MYQVYFQNGREDNDFIKFQEEIVSYNISEVIDRGKEEYQNYIALKLNDPKTNAKTYWWNLKTNDNSKKELSINFFSK